MGCVDKLGDCTRSRTVRILLLILLVILIVVGVFWLVRSSDDASNLDFSPKAESSSLIQFRVNEGESVRSMTNKIEEFLKPYNTTSKNIYRGCNFYNNPPAGKTCDVDLKSFDPCSRANSYGYNKGTPCVFLKLSKDPDWAPVFYNETRLPESMPDDLKQDIKNYVATSKRNAQIVWISCEGKTAEDAKAIGPITYFPRRGFPGYYFPCTSNEGCTEPLVAVHFDKPAINTRIGVQCRIWADNVEDKIDFDLLIE